MIFSKFFNKSNKLDKELERNLLFAPNYLIREQKVNDNTQYIFGGHSVVTIEQTKGKNIGLYFRAVSQKIEIDLWPDFLL